MVECAIERAVGVSKGNIVRSERINPAELKVGMNPGTSSLHTFSPVGKTLRATWAKEDHIADQTGVGIIGHRIGTSRRSSESISTNEIAWE